MTAPPEANMTTLQDAARKALKALEVVTTPLAKDRQEVLTAMYDLRTALAQQTATKNCPQPEICGSKECEFCRDTAAPAPQAQDGRYIIAGIVWFRKSTNEWVLELSGSINDTSFVSRHTQPAETLPENVPSLSTLYAPAPQPAQGVPETNFGNMPVKFLANGTRFKLSFDTRGRVSSLWNFMDELDGRWVALVAAEDDCHLQSTQPKQEPLTDGS